MVGDAGDFAAALRGALSRRGLTLDRVAAHLRARGHLVSIATLSYWQSGRSVPSRAQSLRAIGALESVLGLPRGSMERLVPAQPRDVSVEPRPACADIVRQRARIDAIVRDLQVTIDHGIERISNHTFTFVDVSGESPSVLCREVLCLTEDAVSGYVVTAGHPLGGIDVVVTPVSGCAPGRVVSDSTDSLCVTELALPSLRRGDMHVVEYELGFHGLPERPLPRAQAILWFVTGIRELHLQVAFLPQAAPSHVTLIEGIGPAEMRVRQPLRTAVVGVTRSYPGPCRVGFEWETAGLAPLVGSHPRGHRPSR